MLRYGMRNRLRAVLLLWASLPRRSPLGSHETNFAYITNRRPSDNRPLWELSLLEISSTSISHHCVGISRRFILTINKMGTGRNHHPQPRIHRTGQHYKESCCTSSRDRMCKANGG